MGNQYHILEDTKQHIFAQATCNRQNIVTERFGVSTQTVCHVIKNFHQYGRVSPKPLRVG